jgi:hypothetical protein
MKSITNREGRAQASLQSLRRGVQRKNLTLKYNPLQMVVPSMTRKEIAAHLLSEIRNNRVRIDNKVSNVAKKMRKAEKKIHTYQQCTGSNTLLTIYIYGIDDFGIDYAIGCWINSEKGLSWASVGQLNQIVFFNGHFFERFSERYLKKKMSIKDAAIEFYREYKVSVAKGMEEIANGVYEIQLPLQIGGLALGIHDRNNDIAIYNTYVSKEMLRAKQIDDIEDYRELNESLVEMDSSQWRLIGEAMKL